MQSNEIITDLQLEKAFVGHNFDSYTAETRRKAIEQACLKVMNKFEPPHSLLFISKKLGLVHEDNYLTDLGRDFLYWSFREDVPLL